MLLGRLSQAKTYETDMQSLAHFIKMSKVKRRKEQTTSVHTTIQSTAASATVGILT